VVQFHDTKVAGNAWVEKDKKTYFSEVKLKIKNLSN
jgi:hypothetical protein